MTHHQKKRSHYKKKDNKVKKTKKSKKKINNPIVHLQERQTRLDDDFEKKIQIDPITTEKLRNIEKERVDIYKSMADINSHWRDHENLNLEILILKDQREDSDLRAQAYVTGMTRLKNMVESYNKIINDSTSALIDAGIGDGTERLNEELIIQSIEQSTLLTSNSFHIQMKDFHEKIQELHDALTKSEGMPGVFVLLLPRRHRTGINVYNWEWVRSDRTPTTYEQLIVLIEEQNKNEKLDRFFESDFTDEELVEINQIENEINEIEEEFESEIKIRRRGTQLEDYVVAPIFSQELKKRKPLQEPTGEFSLRELDTKRRVKPKNVLEILNKNIENLEKQKQELRSDYIELDQQQEQLEDIQEQLEPEEEIVDLDDQLTRLDDSLGILKATKPKRREKPKPIVFKKTLRKKRKKGDRVLET